MKRNSMPKVMAFLLALALVSTSMLSGTFAKYSSEFAGQDTALVAKWEILAFAGQEVGSPGAMMLSESEVKELNLFGHEYTQHILASDGAFIIAPGVDSVFLLAFSNLSDVSAKMEISFEVVSVNALIPIEYNVPEDFVLGDEEDNPPTETVITPSATWVSPGALSAAVVDKIVGHYRSFVTSDGDGFILPPFTGNEGENLVMLPVFWQWPFDRGPEGDAEDTGLGVLSASDDDRTEYKLKITVKATQVAPEIDAGP